MRITLIAAAAALAFDQLSKYIILTILDLEALGGIDVFPPWLNFRMGWNTGINFGLFSGDSEIARWILVGLSLLIAGLVLIWSLRSLRRWHEQVLAGALVGGAVGNATDRIVHGAVVDFLNMSCCGINNPFVFNLADVAIVGGAIGLALFGTIASSKR